MAEVLETSPIRRTRMSTLLALLQASQRISATFGGHPLDDYFQGVILRILENVSLSTSVMS